MKNIFCTLGFHKLIHQRNAVVTSDYVCCGKTSNGEVLQCEKCNKRIFKFINGVKIDLTKDNGLIFIP